MPDRIIRESALTSESLATLSDFGERLFFRLTIAADDYGRFNANPAVIRGRCMPLVGSASEKRIEAGLSELGEAESITLYEVDGRRYGYFKNWTNHQQTRAKKSKYPDPPTSADKCSQMPTDANICSIPGSAPHTHSDSLSHSLLDPDLQEGESEGKPKKAVYRVFPLELASPTPAMRTDAHRIAGELQIEIDVDREFEAWHDDCLAHNRKYADWPGAWRNRIRNAPKFGAKQRASPNGPNLTEGHRNLVESIQRERANGTASGQTDFTEGERYLVPPANGRRGAG